MLSLEICTILKEMGLSQTPPESDTIPFLAYYKSSEPDINGIIHTGIQYGTLYYEGYHYDNNSYGIMYSDYTLIPSEIEALDFLESKGYSYGRSSILKTHKWFITKTLYGPHRVVYHTSNNVTEIIEYALNHMRKERLIQ